MQALRDLLQPERLTAIVEVGVAENEAPPYQRMFDEGLCSVDTLGTNQALVGPLDLLKITGSDNIRINRLSMGTEKVAVHVDVSFFPTHTFGPVDTELRRLGFLAHCFTDCVLTPIVSETAVPHPDPHQLGQAGLFYVRDFTRPMYVEQWKHLALLAHHVCGSYDLAMHAVSALAKLRAVEADAPLRYQRTLVMP